MLVFPECALTGYPPRDIVDASAVNFEELDCVYKQLQSIVNENSVHIIVGTIIKEDDRYYNSAIVFVPNGESVVYHKRALWGWDKENTDINIILFYDVSDYDDIERYEMIKSHIRTRAVENVTYTLSVDMICPYQTAPSALFDRSGTLLCELKRNEEKLLVYDLEKKELDFGEQGRKEVSDWLVHNN